MRITRSLVDCYASLNIRSLKRISGHGHEIQTFRSDFETVFPGLGVGCCFPNLDFKQSRA